MRSALPLAALVLLLPGCAHLDYIGESTTLTSHVDVYYSEANVPRPYRVMGEIVATANLLVSNRRVQRKMVEKAQQKGADAVVLLGMEHYLAGQSTSYEESTTESKDKKGRTHTTTTGLSTTSVEEKKKIRGLFIKYTTAAELAPTGQAPADSAR